MRAEIAELRAMVQPEPASFALNGSLAMRGVPMAIVEAQPRARRQLG